ncbi:MAG: AAA family ATPase [Dehalococcoidia bacterium]|nr:AAA family ATPase [Dehalococcoidia bacterium]
MRSLQNIQPSAEQLRILTDAGTGFRLIRGAAGSGKTTAALLRLRQLCTSRVNQRTRQGSPEPVRVLALTFNRTLRGYIRQLAAEQVNVPGNLNIEIETFGRWARNLAEQPRVINDDGESWIRPLLRKSAISIGNLDYFVNEVKYILGRFPLDQRERYLEAIRSGRGRAPAVPRELRNRILTEVIVPYEMRKAKSGMVDWNDVALKAAAAPNQNYDVVVVDESQDLSANQIRAIAAHLDKDHATTFIIDAMQRIYPQGFSWREVGINMRRATVFNLTRNHRNTAEIARLASSLVRGLPQEEDGILPDEDACKESGSLPVVVRGKYGEQVSYMLGRIQPSLETGETVAILHPKGGGWFGFTRQTLGQRGIPYCELTRNPEWPTGPELVAISTIHSAKGLEFDHVIMPGLSDEVTPHGDEDGDGTLDSLRRLIAMGIGRARKTVMLGYRPGERSTVFDFLDKTTYDLVEV